MSTSKALSLQEHSETWKVWSPYFLKLAKVVPTVFVSLFSAMTLTIKVN